ncbi:Serine/threonine-protein kinase PknB [Aquisphaera giovannonii]|uniref:Serine/threonine-protein kinase PknB n=1 Tax=Aquisphaera giovannonii TaxID=406548 RepID=A0A5B9W9K2_9BACT|nr:serine/threonine-protein kinase [Aquisphaera giovannonii]QEH37318.1 Serine/threonine-protein kinase PknB [Aquisphaera giovannonii]
MATSVEGSTSGKDVKSLSAVDEASLEKSIVQRGLATEAEVQACKAHRTKIAEKSKESSPTLLEVMVDAKVLTRSQMVRLLKEKGEPARKLEVPGYQILDKLGRGSMGVVYKAKQLSVDRVVALKVLLDSLAQNKEFIKRFEREAKIAAKLSHNNIVNAIDAGEAGGRYYFVMEYVEGPTIKDFLDKNKTFEEKEAIRIVTAVAEALKHASQRGLIHRDIKPENVILMKDGGVKLADLGLARLTDDEKWGLSEAGMAIGTPYYISPEQVRGQTDIDIRADIYSLGATFYHMVTGKVPYGGDNPSEVMRKHVDPRVQLVPPDHLNTNLSSGLGMVIETMLMKNREHRYSNPDDLILDLKCLSQGESPMIAGQRPESLQALVEGESDGVEGYVAGPSEEQMVELAGIVNNRNTIIATIGMLLAVSVITNVILLTVR